MKVSSNNITRDQHFPNKYTFCKLDENGEVAMSENVNPHIAWSDFPAETKSFALILFDSSVPTSGEDVNQPDRTVPATLPRTDFFHWLLINIPATTTELAEGAFSTGVTPKGKSDKEVNGLRQGRNDYTGWFAGDADMAGDYFGYDGPAPPFNDELIHQYHFAVYALDVEKLDIADPIEGQELRKAMEGHVLDQGRLSATFTLNKNLL